MPEQNVILRHPDGREEPRLVAVPAELDVGASFTLEGAEWTVVSKQDGVSVFVCERRST